MTTPDFTTAWQAVAAAQSRLADCRMSDLFAADPRRVARYTLDVADLHVDLSKHLLDSAALEALLQLAQAAELPRWRAALFAGEPVNVSEGRPALHTALRDPDPTPLPVDGQDVKPMVAAMQRQVADLAEAIRSGRRRASGGELFNRVVNLGIGGSFWGPALALEALQPLVRADLRIDFISTVDPQPLRTLLADCDPRRTLFLASSKSFGTTETQLNLAAARAFMTSRLGAGAKQHFIAITANPDKARALGFDDDSIVTFPQWVGGRYSLWSAIGLPAAIGLGAERFAELLAGAAAMDAHFRSAPPQANLPLLLGLIDVWYASFWGFGSRVLLPYDQCLRLLPTYVQQLAMESDGKGVDRDGRPLNHATCPVVWGGNGNDGEHTFYQLLHQGPATIPAEFVICAHGDADLPGHRRRLIAQCLAQAEALLGGAWAPDNPHARCPGNRPSSLFVLPRLTPAVLGALLACHEHRTFTSGVLWRINPFDQFGVELGKRLASRLERELDGADGSGHDPSTAALLDFCRARLQG
ncbi:MAG: glucose-6-phosphate isomerase [Immundisolibacter sp.]